jgi:hypothetical protein
VYLLQSAVECQNGFAKLNFQQKRRKDVGGSGTVPVSERKIKSNFRGIAAVVVARYVKSFLDTFSLFFASFSFHQAHGEQQLSISSPIPRVSTCAVHYSNGK